jgi:hypothetical protein
MASRRSDLMLTKIPATQNRVKGRGAIYERSNETQGFPASHRVSAQVAELEIPEQLWSVSNWEVPPFKDVLVPKCSS